MLHRSLRWSLILVCLAAAMLACQAIAPESETPAAAGRALFSDDFSDPDSGWNRVTAENGQSDYADGAYRIFVNEPNVDIWSIPARTENFKDVRIEVDTYKVGGERDNRFGIICRAVAPDSFYTFIVSSDGYYGIGKVEGQEYSLIGMDSLQPSPAIHQGSAFNRIRADCIGKTLSLTVNDQVLAQVEDLEFASGAAGLIAGTYDTPGTDIRFDNFVIYQP